MTLHTSGHEHELLATIGAAFGKLPSWAQVATVLFFVFTSGMAVQSVLATVRGIPARVEQLEENAAVNDSLHIALDARVNAIEANAAIDRRRIENKIDRVICLQEAAAGQHSYEQCAK